MEKNDNEKPRHCSGEAQLDYQWNPKEELSYCIAPGVGFKEGTL
jgi:hypothetical protein